MNSIVAWGLAIGTGALALFHTQEIRADSFTGADFATWETAAQDSFIQTSVTMAGVVMTQVAPEKSTCIDGWYLGGGQKAVRNAQLRETIVQYDSYHPSGTILAVLLDVCGSLN